MMTKRPIMFTGLMLAGMALLVAMVMVLQTTRQSAKVQRESGSGAQVDPAKLASSPASVATLATTEKPAQASWDIFRGDPALRGWAGAGELKLPLKLAWTFKTDGPVKSSPIVVDGRIYIGSHDGKLYALEADSGKRLWSFATDDVIEAPPLFAEGVVYIGSADGSMYALDALTGKLRWRFKAQDKILGSANAVNDATGKLRSIVFGSYDNHVYALDPADGTLQWKFVTDNFINGAPAVAGEKIVLGACDGKLHVISALDGQVKLAVDLGGPIAGSPAVEGDVAYIGGYNNQFVAVKITDFESRGDGEKSLSPWERVAESPQGTRPGEGRTNTSAQANEAGETAPPMGEGGAPAPTDDQDEPAVHPAVLWTYRDRSFPYFSSPAVAGDLVIFGGRDRRLHAVNKATGKRVWVFGARNKVDSSPVVIGDRVVVGSDDGRLYVVSLGDGKMLWSYTIGAPVAGSPAVVGEWVYVGADDGVVYGFRGAE